MDSDIRELVKACTSLVRLLQQIAVEALKEIRNT